MLGSQRHTKLKSSEAALLAGELKKPSWESRNEGIHERVSFEDSIWGFDLAGGSFYKTPLRVTAVKNDSRAQKAGIRPGDKLLRINDIETETLTIQEAHAMIIESGIHIRLAVSAPDDFEDSYHCWQDPIEEARLLEEQRLKDKDEERRRQTHCRTRADWSLQWPWVSKRRIIYKESNCYMVPSKYELNHSDKFSEHIPGLKQEEDIVLHSKKSETPTSVPKPFEFPKVNENGNIPNDIDVKKLPLNEIKPDKPVVPQTITEETSGDEINTKVKLENGHNIEENKHLSSSELINKKGQSNEDVELENWSPKDNSNDVEADISEQILEEIINSQDSTQDEEQNKILDEILNGKSEEIDEDMNEDTIEEKLEEIADDQDEINESTHNKILNKTINGDLSDDNGEEDLEVMDEDTIEDKLEEMADDQDEINELTHNKVLNKPTNGDLTEDNGEEDLEDDAIEDSIGESSNGYEEINKESQKKIADITSNGNMEEPETLMESVENET